MLGPSEACRRRDTSTREGPRSRTSCVRARPGGTDVAPAWCPPEPTPSPPSAATSKTRGHRSGRRPGLIVLTLDADRICAVTRFLDNDILGYFGLPVP